MLWIDNFEHFSIIFFALHDIHEELLFIISISPIYRKFLNYIYLKMKNCNLLLYGCQKLFYCQRKIKRKEKDSPNFL